MKTINYLYLSLMCFFLFFFLTIFIINGNVIFFDDLIYNFLHQFPLTSFFRIMTELGGVMGIGIVMVLYLLGSKSKKNVQFFLALILLNTVANFVLKQFFVRSRPYYEKLVSASGFSFPSGHTMASCMCYGLFIYFLWQTNIKKIWKVIGTLFFLFIILSVSLSRVYLGVHYASDVLGGFLVSLFFLFFSIFFLKTTKIVNVSS